MTTKLTSPELDAIEAALNGNETYALDDWEKEIRSLLASARREARLEAAAQAFCESFAEHADRCRPCAIAWQNLKSVITKGLNHD